MVRVTKDWNAFKTYAQHCKLGAYQIRKTEEGTEIRVHAGRIGYIAVFADLNDPGQRQQYDGVLRFCTVRGYVEIATTMSDEIFFL